MGIEIGTAALIGSLLAAGGTVYATEESKKAQRSAEQAADRQGAAQNDQLKKAEQEKARQQQEAAMKAADAASRLRARASGYNNRGGTLLTSPQGIVPGSAPGSASISGGQNTLLGQ